MIIPYDDLKDNYPNCLRYEYLLIKNGKDYMPISRFKSFFGKKGTDILGTFKIKNVPQNRINHKPCYEYDTIINAIKLIIKNLRLNIDAERKKYNQNQKKLQEDYKKQVNFYKEILYNYQYALYQLDLLKKKPREQSSN